MIGYRIFEVGPDNGPRTLYHGHNGTRDVPFDTWLETGDRVVHNPGKKTGPGYEEGFHVFTSESECKKYLKGFTRTDRTLQVCPVYFEDAAPKPRSRSGVLLAKRMYVPALEWEIARARNKS